MEISSLTAEVWLICVHTFTYIVTWAWFRVWLYEHACVCVVV